MLRYLMRNKLSSICDKLEKDRCTGVEMTPKQLLYKSFAALKVKGLDKLILQVDSDYLSYCPNDLFQLQVLSFVYECINCLAPIYVKNYFISIHTVHGIGTRQAWKGNLYALRCNTTQYGIRSIHYSGVRLWNSLPIEIKESKSLPNVRKKLKSHFLSSYKKMNFCLSYSLIDCCCLSPYLVFV